MRSSKNRQRSKQNRQRSIGNIVNRVFDSSGPEGKVRGTPQQIIDKYLMLARDAQLSNDRVAEQNFLQHAEHYTRMLGEAQRELQREQELRQQQFGGQQHAGGQGGGQGGVQGGVQGGERPQHGYGQGRERYEPRAERVEEVQPGYAADDEAMAPADALPMTDEDPGIVETPEMRSEAAPVRAERPRREPQDAAPAGGEEPRAPKADRGPRNRPPRRPRARREDEAEAEAPTDASAAE